MIHAAAAAEANELTALSPREYRVGDLIDRRYAIVEALGRDGLDSVFLVLDTIMQRRTQLWLGPDGRYHVRGQRAAQKPSAGRDAAEVTMASPSPPARPRSTRPKPAMPSPALAAQPTVVDPELARPRRPTPAPVTDDVEALDDTDLLEVSDEELTIEAPMPLTRRKSSPRQQAAETATATRPIKPVDSPPPARERRYTPFAGDPFARPLTADEALALLPRTTPARRALALPNDDEEATTLHEQGPHIVGPHIVAPAVIVAQQTGSDALLSQPPRRTFAVGLAVGLVVGAIPALIALLM